MAAWKSAIGTQFLCAALLALLPMASPAGAAPKAKKPVALNKLSIVAPADKARLRGLALDIPAPARSTEPAAFGPHIALPLDTSAPSDDLLDRFLAIRPNLHLLLGSSLEQAQSEWIAVGFKFARSF